MLQLRGVSKRFGPIEALHATDLTIRTGATTVLIGPSGCGKSTLLRLMNGLIWPDSGVVSFEGVTLAPSNVLAIRRRMGYVLQDGGLFPHLTVRGNATLMARYLGWSRARCKKRLGDLVELTRFPGDGLDRYPAQLSGGQRQRVSLMRGLMLDPDVLLLDEPLGALDPLFRSELQADLRQIFGSLQKTVVLVTHDLSEAGYLGDEIVLLREGRILQSGTLKNLLERPADAFVTRFIRAQRQVIEGLETNGT
jgi:osmoprotectant transport system ATP-binding protein